MRSKLKKVIAYIFRGWEEEPPHPLLKILPPIFLDILGYGIILAILYQIGAYLWSFI